MRVYLVRHGEAVSKDIDPERPLSDEGRESIQKLCSFFVPLHLKVMEIWHSDKLRARETAEILSTAIIPQKGLILMEGLSPNDPVSPIRKKIEEFSQDLMIVGHLPFMENLASLLLTGEESQAALFFPEGGIACLEKEGESPWRVLWFLDPHLIL
jgi:phosphohistidine phosphatase